MTRACAFFDMDRTLLRCSTGERWLGFLRRRGEVSLWRTLQGKGAPFPTRTRHVWKLGLDGTHYEQLTA